MKPIIQALLISVLIIGGMFSPVRAQQNTNLLTNTSFDQGDGQNVPGWLYSSWIITDNPSLAGQVDGKLNTDTDGHHCLSISSSQSIHSTQMWWQSSPDIDCKPGGTYGLSVSLKGALKSGSAQMVVAFYFTDTAGKWLAFQELKSDQDAVLPATWQKFEGTITAPDNAGKIGVRLGIVFADGQAEIFFKDPVLVLKSN